MNPVSDERLFAKFRANPPASPALIAEAQAKLSFPLPADYVQFLQQMNGGEGSLGGNAYVALWRVEELGERNVGYEVAEFAPGLFLFGSNGAGEAFAFDSRTGQFRIVAVPFLGMDNLPDAIPIATNFRTFLEVLFTVGIPFSQRLRDRSSK
jgi:SMI1 / KNR4 family (SUKH-1)